MAAALPDVRTSIDFNLSSWATDPAVEGNVSEAIKRIKEAYETHAFDLNLMGLGLNSLPDALGELSDLIMLNITYNRQLKQLPRTLRKISNLTIFTGGTAITQEEFDAVIRPCISKKNSGIRGQKVPRESLLFSKATPEVQARIDQVYQTLSAKGKQWGHAGTVGCYNLLSFSDFDVVAQRIENAPPGKKDLYFIDLGAGYFAWVDLIHSFLRRKYSEDAHHFHVIGVTGEGPPFNDKQVDGNVTTHKIGGFKLENLWDAFPQFGLDLENSVEFIVTSWTPQHLVNPLATIEQAFYLLNPENGFLFGTGFDGACPGERKNSFAASLAATFGPHNYIARQTTTDLASFGLFRSDNTPPRENFAYNASGSIIEKSGMADCFSQCYVELVPKFNTREMSNIVEFGGGFYGFSADVLEKLLGTEKKIFEYQNTIFKSRLFQQDLTMARMYLDSYGSNGAYKVQLQTPQE